MRAIFLTDAHLRSPQDPNFQRLLDFLDQQQNLDGLFLLGDIFEFWLGYKHCVFSSYLPLLERLHKLKDTGTKLFFVEGNHDFNIGPYFTETLDCTVIPDQKVVDWDGKRLLLCHGDLFHPAANYQRLRSFWRSLPCRLLSQTIHPDWVWAFGIWLSDKSQKKRLTGSGQQWDPSPLILPFAKQNSDNDIIVCGHFHQPCALEHEGRQIYAVGDWLSKCAYAEMIDGQMTLMSYSD